MNRPIKLTGSSISIPEDFEYGAVDPAPRRLTAFQPNPSLGPLAAFVGPWTGTGFNTIFRPDNQVTPTALPDTTAPVIDNVLELNLTSESLTFSPSLGSVPNRGSNPQGDIFLNGVPYLQAINDVTTPGQAVGIHVEPGLWMIVPSTNHPAEVQTVARMGSIPHGTTIQAQGTATTSAGPPNIPLVDITPFFIGTGQPNRFPSQTAGDSKQRRIPQDLTSFIANGTITQAMLDDPNSVLRNHIASQNIVSTTEIQIATQPNPPLFGGGTDNIAFLLGDTTTPPNNNANAHAIKMTATFWIETVEHTILIPIFRPGLPPMLIRGQTRSNGPPAPVFSVTPPVEILKPRQIKFTTMQIQYTQTVFLNFAGLSWPHVSVATLVPADPIVIPPSVW